VRCIACGCKAADCTALFNVQSVSVVDAGKMQLRKVALQCAMFSVVFIIMRLSENVQGIAGVSAG
jgi:hypothetical protein